MFTSSKSSIKNTVTIIGAGLVGSAVLRELARGWARTQKEHTPPQQDTQLRYSEMKTISFTARSQSRLIHQIQKTRDVLIREEGVIAEQDSPLTLTISSGSHRLNIEADLLDILPKGLTSSTIDDEKFRKASSLYSFLANKRPDILIMGVNLATMATKMKEIQNLVLAWTLTTLKQAADEFNIETVAIIGTTALGGQGTNMAWSHQSSQQMDANLVNKILAAYGILGIVDRIHYDTDSHSRWIFLSPGSLLGYDHLDFGAPTYFSAPQGLPAEVEEVISSSGLRIPLYDPVEVNLTALSEEVIPWKERRRKEAFLNGAKIKCGESGEFSPMQFACISHAFQMGLNTDVYIARILIDELKRKSTGYNQIPLGSGKIIEPTVQGQNDRDLALRRLAELENGIRSPPVYPALGSPRAQKEIVSADLLFRFLTDHYGEPTLQQIAEYDPISLANDLWNYLKTHPQLLSEITAVIPVISPSGQIFTGPHVMYLNTGIIRTSDLAELTDTDRFLDFAALGAIDLRPMKDRVERELRVYETGVEILINRAKFILDKNVDAFPPTAFNVYGSAIDPRILHWQMLTSGSQTIFDPVFFVVQFLGGARPFQ
jgi:hypothetical protein